MDRTERMNRGKIPGSETGIDVRRSVCTICDPVTADRPAGTLH
jgi:hypothetical protein